MITIFFASIALIVFFYIAYLIDDNLKENTLMIHKGRDWYIYIKNFDLNEDGYLCSMLTIKYKNEEPMKIFGTYYFVGSDLSYEFKKGSDFTVNVISSRKKMIVDIVDTREIKPYNETLFHLRFEK